MHPVKRALRVLLSPLFRIIIRHMPVQDPWEQVTDWVKVGALGGGSRHPFSWYLEGQSAVSVASVDEICDWLAGCQYVPDPVLFHEPDFWQHPLTFEQLRRGDCEDYALWAWRKMLELKIDARFVVGNWLSDSGRDWGGHAWVEFVAESKQMHLEPVRRDRARMIQPLDAVRSEYVPHYTVNSSLKPYANAGLILYWRHEQEQARVRRSDGESQAA